MPIKCLKCGSVDNYRVEVKSVHHVAYCNSCDSFIKNIPYDLPKLYVGKYKGVPINQIMDADYLKWANLNMNSLNERQRKAIDEQIQILAK